MLEEDVVLKEARYGNERLLTVYIVAMVLLTALFGGGNTLTGYILMISLSLLVPFNVINYPINWIDAPEYTRLKFFLCLSPYVLLVLFTVFRLSLPMLTSVGSNTDGPFYIDQAMSENIFSSMYTDGLGGLAQVVVIMCIAATALSIYFITQSRFIIRNMLAFCSGGVAVFALIGFISSFFYKFNGPSLSNVYGRFSFFTFFDSHSWAYFAMIWSAALFGAGIYTFQRFELQHFILSVRTGVIVTATFLALSAAYAGCSLHTVFIFAQLSVFFAIYAYNVFPTDSSLRKHMNTPTRQKKRNSDFVKARPFIIYLCLSFVFLLLLFNSYSNYKALAETSEGMKYGGYEKILDQETSELIAERPVFGWGANSFTEALVFKQGDDLEFSPNQSASSDLNRALTEYGVAGFVLLLFVPAVFFIKMILKPGISSTGLIFMTAIVSILISSIISTPFNSYSVLLSFWVLLFSLFAWEDAEII